MQIDRDIKLGWRQAMRRPLLSLLMIGGIAIGVCSSLLLASYIIGQFSFDSFHTERQRIVRVQNDHLINGEVVSRSAMTYAGVPVLAKERLPAVEDYVRIGHWIANDVVFRHDESVFRGKDCLFADPSFFSVFSFKLLQGDPATALVAPNSLVLTEKIAQKLFGDKDPMGQEVLFENFKPFIVTGVVQDPGPQSHIQFDLLPSLSTMSDWGLRVYGDDQFESSYIYAYLLLRDQTDLDVLSADLTTEVARVKNNDQQSDLFTLQPLSEIHLYSNLENELGETGNGENLKILAIIALLIIILAWLNHINIFSALGIDQSGALSIRRIVGAERKHLLRQVFSSGALYAFTGLILGCLLMLIAQPILNNHFEIPTVDFRNTNLALHPTFLLLLLFFGTVLICVLPAVLLSKVSAKEFLENKKNTIGNLMLRRALVVAQFTIIVVLLICTGIVYLQMDYLQKRQLGFRVDEVIAVPAPLGTSHEKMQAALPVFAEKVRSISGIISFSTSHDIPGNQLEHIDEVSLGGLERKVSLYRNYGDIDYFETYQIPFIQLADEIAEGDARRHLVINERAVQQLGFADPTAAMGQEISFWGNDPQVISGVIADHHQRSLHHPLLPMIYNFSRDGLMTDGYYSLRLNAEADRSRVMNAVKEAYQEAFPYTVFESIYVDDHYKAQYRADDHFKTLNLAFTIIGVLVACFGLLGLIIIAVGRRTKEISIRKTLGASVQSIFILLSREFFKLVFIAILIAAPIAYYVGLRWLENFTYQTNGLYLPFVIAVMIVMLLTLLTVSHQCLHAARIDPAETLRSE